MPTRDERLLREIEELKDAEARRAFFAQHQELGNDFLERLLEGVRSRFRDEPAVAHNLALASLELAGGLDDSIAVAKALRSLGTARYGLGDYRAALESYDRATSVFESASASLEAARTLSTSLQPRILLGNYDSAFDAADRARAIYEKLGDRLRQARLDINAI